MQGYKYFNRDVSWLSYDKLVLESAESEDISMVDRLNFVSFHSSNLDEFYSVRVAEYRKAMYDDTRLEEVSHPDAMLLRINSIVSQQMAEAVEIMRRTVCPELQKLGVVLHWGSLPTHEVQCQHMVSYFNREVIPYLQPLLLGKGTMVFLRDNRPYFALKLHARRPHGQVAKRADYALLKLPINDLPRFVTLPQTGDGLRHVVFLDDIIRYNIQVLFPGYEVEGMWSVKVSRDADLGLHENSANSIVQEIRENLVNRKTGVAAGLYYDSEAPADLLAFLCRTFGFGHSEMIACGRYLNLHHLAHFPSDVIGSAGKRRAMQPLSPRHLQVSGSIMDVVAKADFMLHYPYQSFDYVIRLFNEAARDPEVTEIMVTQYRAATNSAVVESLIAAASNNKKVTVFVELKARFDEKNNLELAERMQAAGIRIIYSIPGLKVHAKVALILRDGGGKSVAYVSTGNFNEQTARCYTDHGLFTSDPVIIDDLATFFAFLENQKEKPVMRKLLVTQINLKERLVDLIDQEIAIARSGAPARIVLKVNGLQYRPIIDKLYDASKEGVRVDLIVRGICCLVPNQSYSKNIRVIRIVDCHLEHGRVWAFGPNGERGVFITSSDCLNRNIKRRIETAVPIENYGLRQELMRIVELQLSDNLRAREIDENLRNVPKGRKPGEPEVWAQRDIYDVLE